MYIVYNRMTGAAYGEPVATYAEAFRIARAAGPAYSVRGV